MIFLISASELFFSSMPDVRSDIVSFSFFTYAAIFAVYSHLSSYNATYLSISSLSGLVSSKYFSTSDFFSIFD